jgi:phage shock protein PspC (stress-responsive transcriptional regulator)
LLAKEDRTWLGVVGGVAERRFCATSFLLAKEDRTWLGVVGGVAERRFCATSPGALRLLGVLGL